MKKNQIERWGWGGVKGCINFEIKGGVFGGRGAKILYFSPGKSLTLTHGDLSCE